MKKYIAAVSMAVLPLLATAQNAYSYLPFVEEGKTWMVNAYPMGQTSLEPTATYGYVLSGDTLLNDRTVKKLYSWTQGGGDLRFAGYGMYEEAGKVHLVTPNGKDLVHYDFSLKKGETGTLYMGEVEVLDEFYVESHGATRRALRVGYRASEGGRLYQEVWVEGVGTRKGYVSFYHLLSGNNTLMCECKQGDEVLFTSEDFAQPPDYPDATRVSTPAQAAPSSAVYDLQGRNVTGSGLSPQDSRSVRQDLPRGVYIQNGRKVVVR